MLTPQKNLTATNNCDYYMLGGLKMMWKGFLKFEKMTFLN